MNGETHVYIANLALAVLSEKERHILYPRWGGIESGATMSDYFRMMWEIESPENPKRQLIHRCYVDSDDKKNHGGVTHAFSYSDGSLSFIEDFKKGELEGAYDESSFLENLGMFLGVISHHIADLCTPVHVGHKIDYKSCGFKKLSQLHAKVERDISRLEKKVPLYLAKPTAVDISTEYFWEIAKDTYKDFFLNLEKVYCLKDEQMIADMVSKAISNAVNRTACVWHTILLKTGMMDRDWSMQPLL